MTVYRLPATDEKIYLQLKKYMVLENI